MSTKKSLTKLMTEEFGPASFGTFLTAARASKDLSQVEMAKTLKISRSTLCDIEKGRHLVSPSLASKIARICGLSEALAIALALQDQIRKAKLKFKVQVEAA